MTWDATALQVATHALGAVESGMAYDAVNSTDPITVGIIQWYGTRAAAILDRMKTENASAWTGVDASIDSDLTAHAATDSYWNTRYLTASEANSLKPVLAANTSIENDQAATDINGYKQVAVNNGMNADTNTDAVIFFTNMYNQGPRYALRVLAACGPDSNLDRIYAYCLNDPVLGQYRNRYATAYQIISTHDTSGVATAPVPPSPPPANDGGNTGATQPTGDVQRIVRVGDHLQLAFKDGHTLLALSDGHDRWMPTADSTVGAPIPTPPPPPPPSSTAAADIIAWLNAHIGAYAYGQGPSRLSPDTNHYTDCSGLMYYAFKTVANVYIGTWTGDQINHGSLITTNTAAAAAATGMSPGDLIFYRWSSSSPWTYDHVDMYIGGNQVIGHGGPGNGPTVKTMDTRVNAAASIMVRRYV